MPFIPANIPNDIIGVGSSERFTPSVLPSTTLSNSIMSYFKETPSFINEPTPNTLTLGSAQDYKCDFNYSTFECNNPPLPPTAGYGSILTSNYPAQVARQEAIYQSDLRKNKKTFAQQWADTNLFVLVGLPFVLFFIAKKFVK